jgi:hypothetical protein
MSPARRPDTAPQPQAALLSKLRTSIGPPPKPDRPQGRSGTEAPGVGDLAASAIHGLNLRARTSPLTTARLTAPKTHEYAPTGITMRHDRALPSACEVTDALRPVWVPALLADESANALQDRGDCHRPTDSVMLPVGTRHADDLALCLHTPPGNLGPAAR